jgi:L-ribulose-5-phosphate 3-epimerase
MRSSHIAVGVVQGRLVPSPDPTKIQVFPQERWTEEFSIAQAVGCSHIELSVADEFTPFMNMSQADIKFLRERFHVVIDTVCYDALLTCQHGSHAATLAFHVSPISDVIRRCAEFNIKSVVIPLLEIASLWLPSERTSAMRSLEKIRNIAHDNSIKLSLETDLPAIDIAELAKQLGVGITFDMGNIARRGYDLGEHIEHYGHLVDNIHVKDCTRGGTSVPLGSGDAGMGNLHHLIRKSRLSRVTLQVCRPKRMIKMRDHMSDADWFQMNAARVRMWIDDPGFKVTAEWESEQ